MPEPIVSHIQFSEEIKPVNDVGVEKATDAQAEIDLLASADADLNLKKKQVRLSILWILTAVTSNCSSVATY
jgi:hypothetical protein